MFNIDFRSNPSSSDAQGGNNEQKMKWLGNYFLGSNGSNNDNDRSGGGEGDDHDEIVHRHHASREGEEEEDGRRRRRRRQHSTTSNTTTNSRTKDYYHHHHRAVDDDLYLSDDDDDDWGMSSSAFSATRDHHRVNNSNNHNPTMTTTTATNHDQFPFPGEEYYEDEDEDEQRRWRRRSGGRQHKYYYRSSSSSSAFWDQISMNDEPWRSAADPNYNNNNNDRGPVAQRGNIEDRVNDQKHDRDRRRQRPSSSGAGDSAAEKEVQEEKRSLELERSVGGQDEDDNISSTSSKKEEVANAYRDYLKSIRDGGFESYLDNTTTTTSDNPNIHEDGELERVLDLEEERASGTLYRDLYGVHDMRGMASCSPYSEWRAKAKALLRQEEILDKNRMGSGNTALSSPSRKILDRFRRKRRAAAAAGSGGGRGGGGGGGHNRLRKQTSNEYADEIIVGDVGGSDAGICSKCFRYRVAIFRHPLFKGMCVLLCVILAFGAGISYYMRTSSHEASSSSSEHGITAATEQSNKSQGKNSSRPSDAILNALSTFEPVWFDRRTGWEGITFMEAVRFCATHKDRVPCPFEIYCNKDDGTPYDGVRPGGEQWAAISNGANQWVQVGEMFTCQRYTDLHDHKKPEWGITGVSSEHEHGAGGITQNILCCVDVYRIGSLDPFTQWGKNPKMENVKEDNTKETTNSSSVNVADTDSELNPNKGNVAAASKNIDAEKQEKAVIAAFQPVWFSSKHGWSGKSYEDAVLFCESFNHMVLCPYAAYCPNGRARSPLPGSMIAEIEGEQWAPANGPMNTWVQVGTVGGDESTRCTLHHEILGERPVWGIDGTRSELKHHILCCLM